MKRKAKLMYIIGFVLSVVVLSILLLLFTPMRVDGNSMANTFTNNDIVVVSKIMSLECYDIIVFRYEKEKFMKRIIGVSGDIIKIEKGILYRNNEMLIDYHNDIDIEDTVFNINKDEYYVVGDNALYSDDSRVYGLISKENILGKVINGK